MKKKVIVIGAGFGGISAATYLASQGYDVTVLEKNAMPGGRAQVIKDKGFVFDAGPSWYMMPDIFEEYFKEFGHDVNKLLKLKKLNPSYRVITNEKDFKIRPQPYADKVIHDIDPAAYDKFSKYFRKGEKDYKEIREGILDLPMLSLGQSLNPKVLKYVLSKDMFTSYERKIKSITTDEDLQHTLQFMAVFLGGSPKKIPAFYGLLTYVDMGLGIFYPQGGFGELARVFEKVAKEKGVKFKYDQEVEKIETNGSLVSTVKTNKKNFQADIVVANADYHHVETKLLANDSVSYPQEYWDKKDLSPSALLFFLGLDRKVENLNHHSLFFDADWDKHFADLDNGKITSDPMFYVSTPSLSDSSVAPKGKENLFVLVPVPAGKNMTKAQEATVYKKVTSRISKQVGFDINKHIVTKKIRSQKYFKETFNALKGNAFGLSHTTSQSAMLRPRLKSKKLDNLYFVGQYSNPGTGVPMVVLSGKVVSKLIAEEQIYE